MSKHYFLQDGDTGEVFYALIKSGIIQQNIWGIKTSLHTGTGEKVFWSSLEMIDQWLVALRNNNNGIERKHLEILEIKLPEATLAILKRIKRRSKK